MTRSIDEYAPPIVHLTFQSRFPRCLSSTQLYPSDEVSLRYTLIIATQSLLPHFPSPYAIALLQSIERIFASHPHVTTLILGSLQITTLDTCPYTPFLQLSPLPPALAPLLNHTLQLLFNYIRPNSTAEGLP